jgi:uncharacterized protein YbjT (DUF2867 family)
VNGACAVTGAFGYSGRRIARRLLEAGREVRALTNSPGRDPFGGRVKAFPLAFDDPHELEEALRGCDTLFNTYWVRFDWGGATHDIAVENSRKLFRAAWHAGVRRVVHVSITNPSEESPLPYFNGKARVERALRESGLAHSILRPAVLFGEEDILLNNIAWMLRRFPVFFAFGSGEYRLRPFHVEDMAALAVREAGEQGARVVQAVGPESFTFRELLALLGKAVGSPRPVVSVPAWLGMAASRVLGLCLRDVVLTREEIDGLMAGLLDVDAPAAGPTRLSAWLAEHGAGLGVRYHSELARRRDRETGYGKL